MTAIDRRGFTITVTGATVESDSGPNASVAIKTACVVATTSNISLVGEQTINGVSVVDGDRVLVASQSTPSENGIYDCALGQWSRAVDSDGNSDFVSGTVVHVSGGTTGGNAFYKLTYSGVLDIDTTSITVSNASLSDAFTGDSGSGGAKGLVPAPAAGDAAANKFLKSSGSFAAVQSASDTVSGIIELATNAEAATGTDIARALTPASSKYALLNGAFFTQTGTDASTRTLIDKSRDLVSVSDFYYTIDADYTNAFTRALAAHGCVYVPAGIFPVSSKITLSANKRLIGAGKYVSVIRSSSASAVIVEIDGGNTELHDLKIDASVTRTSGASVAITTNASNVTIEDVLIASPFHGITIPNVAIVRLKGVRITDAVATSGISVSISGGFAIMLDDLVCTADTAAKPYAHIHVTAIADLTLVNSQLISGGIDLNLAPGNSQSIELVSVCDTMLDDAGTSALRIAPATGGAVREVYVLSPWIKGATSDVLITDVGGGTVASVNINGCLLVGTGIGIDADGVSCINVKNCVIGNHSTAVKFNDVAGGEIQNNHIGSHGLYSANTTGIDLGGTSDYLTVTGNYLVGNTTPFTSSITGANSIIAGNNGYPALAMASISVGASPFTYTSGMTRETIYINAGTVSLVTVNGTNVLQSSNHAITVDPHSTVTVTYSGAPTMVKTLLK